MAAKCNLSILQWNIRSVWSNNANLIKLINEKQPDLIALSETWLNHTYTFNIPSYFTLRDDRQDGKGGTALLIKNNLNFKINQHNIDPHLLNSNFQSITFLENNLTIFNIYIPPHVKLLKESWLNLLVDFPGPKIVLGDFNGQHPSWGSTTTNHNGKIIEGALEELDLVILNDGSPTRITPPEHNISVVDLSLVSSHMANHASWETIQDTGSSDHFPIFISFCNQNLFDHSINFKRKNFKKADWNSFHDNLSIDLLSKPDITYKEFIDLVEQTSNKTIPTFTLKNNPSKIISPWWDDECQSALLARRKAVSNFKNISSLENFLMAKKAIAQTKKIFKSKKKTSFKNFCESLNRETPFSKIWKTTNKFSGKKINMTTRPIPRETLLGILNNLTCVDIIPEFILNPIHSNFSPFTFNELLSIIDSRKNSAPGMDEISYLMVKHFPIKAQEKLLFFLNKCLLEGLVQKDWKKSLIHPIPKNNNDLNNPKNFRPIALNSCIGKLLELLLKNRIEWELEHSNYFPAFQLGFRKGKGCTECISSLHTLICRNFQLRRKTLIIFLDITAAYDNVNIYKLYNKLIEANISPNMANIIFNLLLERQLYIKNGNTLIGPNLTSRGVAQGSPLSPLLFNVYTKSLHTVFDQEITTIQYADDMALVLSGDDLRSMTSTMNMALVTLSDWLVEHNLELSTGKTKAMLFAPRKSENLNNFNLYFKNQKIEWSEEIKYLGVIFTYNLNWTKHFSSIAQKAAKGINVIRALSRVWWGSDPLVLLTLYKAIVRSHFDYCCQVFLPNTQKNLSTLDKLQYQAFRIITGCTKSTPTNALLAETGETSLHVRRTWLCEKFILKNMQINNNILFKLLDDLSNSMTQGSYFNNRSKPNLLTQYRELSNLRGKFNTYDRLPCFEYNLENQYKKIPVIHLDIPKDPIIASRMFKEKIEKWKNFHLVYTDASKDLTSNTVGIGIFSPSLNISFSSNISNRFQICSAEVMAIHKGIKLCIAKKSSNLLILTDSKSALMKIAKVGMIRERDNITYATRQLILDVNILGHNVCLGWIPSHVGIHGNEQADKLANIGRILNVPLDISPDFYELIPILKKKIEDNWKSEWKLSLDVKGSFYKLIQSEFSFTPWFRKQPYINRRHITTIIRMRVGHCLTPAYLYRINRRESPDCDCGEEGTLQHILLDCPLSNISIYQPLCKTGIPAPFSIITLLRDLNPQAQKIIISFLIENNKDI